MTLVVDDSLVFIEKVGGVSKQQFVTPQFAKDTYELNQDNYLKSSNVNFVDYAFLINNSISKTHFLEKYEATKEIDGLVIYEANPNNAILYDRCRNTYVLIAMNLNEPADQVITRFKRGDISEGVVIVHVYGMLINLASGEVLSYDPAKHIRYINEMNATVQQNLHSGNQDIFGKPQKALYEKDPFNEVQDVMGIPIDRYGRKFVDACFYGCCYFYNNHNISKEEI